MVKIENVINFKNIVIIVANLILKGNDYLEQNEVKVNNKVVPKILKEINLFDVL